MAEHITGGELHSLWRVSEVNLPRVAGAYYEANQKIAKGHWDDSAGFRSVATGIGGAAVRSPLGAAWGQLEDEILTMLGKIENTIKAGAAGIRQATKDFVETDQAGANELSNYLANPANQTSGQASKPPNEKPGKPVMPNA